MKNGKAWGLAALAMTFAVLGLATIIFEEHVSQELEKSPPQVKEEKQTKAPLTSAETPLQLVKDSSGEAKKSALKTPKKPKKPVNRIVFRGEAGAWYQVGFLLKNVDTKRPHLFLGSDKGIVDVSSLETGRYRLTINKTVRGVSLDPRYDDELILELDNDKPADHHVFLVSEFPRELVVKGHITVNGEALQNVYASVSWRGVVIKLWQQEPGIYLGKHYVRHETKPGPAKVAVHGIGIPFTTFQVSEISESQRGQLSFERDIKARVKGVKIDIQGSFIDEETGQPIAGERFPIRINDLEFTLNIDAKGQFSIRDILSTSRFYLDDSDPRYTLYIKQNKARSITIGDIRGDTIEIVRRAHTPSTLALSLNTRKLFDSKRIPNGVMVLLPLSSVSKPIDSKRVSRIATGQERQLALGELDMRPLPAGLYYLVLSLTGEGTFTKRFRSSGRGGPIDVDMTPTNTAYSLTLTDNGEPAQNALILDGLWPHVSFKTVQRLFQSMEPKQSLRKVMKVPFKQAAGLTDGAGRIVIERSNAANSKLTVFTQDGRCFHLPKKSGSFKLQDYKGSVLSGIVTDNQGNPLQGVQVQLTSLRGGEKHGYGIRPDATEFIDRTTDDQGRYEISGIVPGEYLLCLCFSTKRMKQKGVMEKHYQIDEESFQIVNLDQSTSSYHIKMTRSVKRCDSCGLYHIDKRH